MTVGVVSTLPFPHQPSKHCATRQVPIKKLLVRGEQTRTREKTHRTAAPTDTPCLLPSREGLQAKNHAMIYIGKRDDGTWEEFEADCAEDATPEATGYVEVKQK